MPLQPESDPCHPDWMRRAVDLGKQSVAEDGRPLPRVGAVAVRDGELLAEGFRGKTGPGDHAEYGLIKEAQAQSFSGATLYTTLEPCSRRGPDKTPCAQRVIDSGFVTVVIGTYDPNPSIYREGWRILRDAGIHLLDFVPSLRADIQADNAPFVDSFRFSAGNRGTAKFDYTLYGGGHEIRAEQGTFVTRWTNCGRRSIYALDYDQHVAHARYAVEFAEVDDPGALDFSNYTVPLSVGEIGVFRTPNGYLLVKIVNVVSNEGGEHELTFDYESRAC